MYLINLLLFVIFFYGGIQRSFYNFISYCKLMFMFLYNLF